MLIYHGDMVTLGGEVQQVSMSTLRLLVALAEEGSISEAARRIGMAQSNASRSLKALEANVGVQLIVRAHSGAYLTDRGNLLALWAQEVVTAMDRLLVGMNSLSGTSGGQITVGASHTVAEHLAPEWLATFHRHSRAVTVALDMENSERVLDGVARGEFDLGFVECPEVPDSFTQVEVRVDALKLIVHPGHEWAALVHRDEPLLPSVLAKTPLILRESGSGTRAVVSAALAPYGGVRTLMELNSTSAIVRAVEAGVGPALLSGLSVEAGIREGRLVAVPVLGQTLERCIRAVWLPSSPPRGEVRDLLSIAVSGQSL